MQTVRLLAYFFRPHRMQAAFLILISSISSMIDALSIATIYPLLNNILLGQSAGVLQQGKLFVILNRVIAQVPVKDSVVASCLVVIGMTVVNDTVGFLVDTFSKLSHLKFKEKYVVRAYEKIFQKEYGFFVEKKQGEIIYLGMNCSQAVGEVFHFGTKTIVEVFRVVFILGLLVTISFKATLYMGVFAAFIGGMYHLFSSRITYPYAVKIRLVTEQFVTLFTESISGIKQIKIFQNFDHFYMRYKSMIGQERQYHSKSMILSEVPGRVSRLLSIALILVVVIYIRVVHPESFSSALPVLVVFMMATQRMLPSLLTAGTNWVGLKELSPRLEVIKAIDEEPAVKSHDGAPCPVLKDAVRFENVDFSYSSSPESKVLDKISFSIPAKKFTALVGPSGAGKSTIVDILVGLYKPTAGKILFDGNNLGDYSLSSWNSKLATLSQDPFLFHRSIEENILLGRQDASHEDVVAAAKLSNAHEFISALPEGYATIIGDRGVKLSGGQKQRIAMAKALIRNPEILIMDEATSALDNISEKVFQENIKNLQQKKTILMIAHRLSTVEGADQILVIDKGRIVESGNHSELLARKGLYYDLYMKQGETSHA